MSLDPLLAGLRAATDQPLTAIELAEAVWLAPYLTNPAPAGRSDGPDPPAPREPPPVPPGKAAAGDRAGTDPDPTAPTGPGPAGHPARPEDALFYVPGGDPDAPVSLTTRSPAVPALPRTLALARALRPVRERTAPRRDRVLDEEATAQASASARRWLPRHRLGRSRRLELALVIDDSPSMVVWRRMAGELQGLLERLGAFRDVRVWHIDSGVTGTDVPVLRAGAPGIVTDQRSARDPRELLGPEGRRMVLVVSDCVGPAWGGGVLLGWLEQWAGSGPTAIVQPLPQRLWGRCALDIARVRLAATRPLLPNHRLGVVFRDEGMPARGVAVPVLEPEPRWLAPWARLVAGDAPGGVWGAAVFTGWSPRNRLFAVAPDETDRAEEPERRLRRFRANTSPEVFELARYLAAAPLSLPVMRLVQSVMLPRSRPRHLAEVFLSDLLRRITPHVARQDPEHVIYDFRPGVRELLAATLAPHTGLGILAEVSDYIRRRFGAALDFPAILAGADVPMAVDEASRPFAAVAQTVLRALGGRYQALADRLGAATHRAPLVGPTAFPPGPLVSAPALPPSSHTSITRAVPLGETVSTIDSPPADGPDEQLPAQPAVWGGVPPRNPNFTGRQELLVDLREQLTSKVTALLPHTLHGLGGVGKTQLAIEYIYRYSSAYDLIWWIPSEQAPLMRQSLLALAPRLNLGAGIGDDVAQTLTAINDALRQGRPYRRWLLVFDNADRPEDLAPFLANPGGHILITSRNRSWSGVAETVEVDVFERMESIELLHRRLPEITDEEADDLAERLGDLPLALEQAAAWQAATATPTVEYLRLLEGQAGALLSESKPHNYPEPVAVAWGLAFNELVKRAPAALQMLELCAFLGSEPISVRLLREGRHVQLPEPLRSTVRDDIPMRRAIRDINRYGLAKIDSAKGTLQVHRLVQAVLRDRMSGEQRDLYRHNVHALLAAADPGDPSDDQSWSRHAELSPHVVPAGLVDAEDKDVRRVVLDQIRYRWMLGDFESSRELGELTWHRWRERIGPDHEQTLVAGRFLGVALRSLGRVKAARELNEEVLARSRSTFGPDHEHTLATANSVGADLRLRGEWRKARDLDLDLLPRHRRVFGEDDTSTLLSANNLAVDYRLLGEFTSARDVDEETAGRLRRVLGAEHPYTLRMISNLSLDYYGLGDYRQALELQRWSLPIHRRLLGADHAEVLWAIRIHVITLRRIGATLEAYERAEEMTAISRRRFGDNHKDTIGAAMTLANCLAAVGRMDEARVAGEDSLARYRELLGEEHPFTLAAMTNLATVLRALGDHAAARALDERAYDGFRAVLGDQHSYTLCTRINLANDLAAVHDHQGALEHTRGAWTGLTELYGPDHSQVIVTSHNLAIDLAAVGNTEEARETGQEAINRLRDVVGNHPDIRIAEAGGRLSIEIEPPNP